MLLGDATNGWDAVIAGAQLAGVVVTALLADRVRRAVRTPSGDTLGAVAERTHDLADDNAAALGKLNGRRDLGP